MSFLVWSGSKWESLSKDVQKQLEKAVKAKETELMLDEQNKLIDLDFDNAEDVHTQFVQTIPDAHELIGVERDMNNTDVIRAIRYTKSASVSTTETTTTTKKGGRSTKKTSTTSTMTSSSTLSAVVTDEHGEHVRIVRGSTFFGHMRSKAKSTGAMPLVLRVTAADNDSFEGVMEWPEQKWTNAVLGGISGKKVTFTEEWRGAPQSVKADKHPTPPIAYEAVLNGTGLEGRAKSDALSQHTRFTLTLSVEESKSTTKKSSSASAKRSASASKKSSTPAKKKQKSNDGSAREARKRHRVDPYCSLSNARVVEDFNATLQLTNISGNNNKFYIIQLLSSGNAFYAYNRWGRTGEPGRTALHGPSDRATAEAAFTKKFFDKTKNEWSAREHFEQAQNKYAMLEIELESVDDEEVVVEVTRTDTKTEVIDVEMEAEAEAMPDELQSEAVRQLVEYLYGEATVGLTSKVNAKITRRGIETPVGVLSYAQVRKGDDVLDRIAVELSKEEPNQRLLQGLSSEYYTKIPHNLGRSSITDMVIRTWEKWHEKQELSQLMKDMLQVQGKSEKGHNVLFEEDIRAKYDALGCTVRHVAKDSVEYRNVVQFCSKHRLKSHHKNFTIDRSDGFDATAPASAVPAKDVLGKKIRNVFSLYRGVEHQRYDGEAIGNEHMLFHASRIQNWVGILSRGLLMPHSVTKLGVKRTDFGWLGAGIYFGGEWMTSEQYCVPGKKGTGCMLVCKVALGKVQEQVKQDGAIVAPNAGFDSIHGNPDAPGSEFDEHEFICCNAKKCNSKTCLWCGFVGGWYVSCKEKAIVSPKAMEYIEREAKYGAHNYHPLPVVLTRGQGVHVWDVEGKRYTDFLSAYSAVNQGHCHPRLVEVMKKQIGQLTLTSRAFYNDSLGAFYEKMHDVFGYDKTLPMNTGVECTDSAVKLCRKWAYEVRGVAPNKAEIVFARENFHGRSIVAVSASTDSDARDNFGPFVPLIHTVKYNSPEAVEERLKACPNVCAVILEPVQGEAGVIVPDSTYLPAVRELCTKHNVLLVLDEVQSGVGRTGKMLAAEHSGVRADIVTMGKALSGGMMPIAAVIANDEIMLTLQPGQHGSTFGGNPLAAKVAIEALSIIEEEGLLERSLKMGEHLRKRLSEVQCAAIRDVRGLGLMNAVEFDESEREGVAYEVCVEMAKRGVLAKPTHDTTIRLTPPLVITEEEIDEAVDAFAASLKAVDVL